MIYALLRNIIAAYLLATYIIMHLLYIWLLHIGNIIIIYFPSISPTVDYPRA